MNKSLMASGASPKRVSSVVRLNSPGRGARAQVLTVAYRLALSLPVVAALASPAMAQAVAPTVSAAAPATAAPPAAVAPVVSAAPAPEVAPVAPAPVAEPVPEASVAPPVMLAEPMPAPEAPVVPEAPVEEKLPSVDLGVWMRVSALAHNPTKPKRLDDIGVNAYGEVHLSGKVHKMVSYTLNLNASGLTGAGGTSGQFGIMDAILGLDFDDLFHIWGGQLLVASDRSNFSGPFFMIPWNYPGLAGGAAGPMEGPSGRNIGTTVWGDAGKGKFKYYVGAYGLHDATKRPFYTARLNLAIIGAEPGFYHNSTYYGDQNILALGVGAQYQNDGYTIGKDYALLNTDLLAEFKLGESVVTGEGAVYGFPTKGGPYHNSFMLLGAFLTPKTPIGKLQPMLRYQRASAAGDAKDWILDASLGLVIKGFNLRGTLGFQHADLGNLPSNSMHLGVQAIEF